jgi:ankyrin repeat protein
MDDESTLQTDEKYRCSLCFYCKNEDNIETLATAAFFPCGHFLLCENHSKRLKESNNDCPLCHRHAESIRNIHAFDINADSSAPCGRCQFRDLDIVTGNHAMYGCQRDAVYIHGMGKTAWCGNLCYCAIHAQMLSQSNSPLLEKPCYNCNITITGDNLYRIHHYLKSFLPAAENALEQAAQDLYQLNLDNGSYAPDYQVQSTYYVKPNTRPVAAIPQIQNAPAVFYQHHIDLLVGYIEQSTSDNDLNFLAQEIIDDHGEIINAHNHRGICPLHASIRSSNDEIMGHLLLRNANVNLIEGHHAASTLPLNLAITLNKMPMVRLLLSHGADVNYTANFVFSPLHTAVLTKSYECLKLMLRTGPHDYQPRLNTLIGNVSNGETLLILATQMDDSRLVKLLLEFPVVHFNLMMAVRMAIAAKNLEITALLYSKLQEFNAFQKNGERAVKFLKYAAEVANVAVFTFLVGSIQKDFFKDQANILFGSVNYLRLALLFGNTVLARHLIFIDQEDHYNINECFFLPLAEDNAEMIELFLNHRLLDTDYRSEEISNEKTYLHYAVGKGHNNTVLQLLNARFNVNALDANNRTVLHYACYNGNVKLVKLFLKGPIDVTLFDIDECTALHYACATSTEISNILLRNGADPDARGPTKGTPPILFAIKKNNYTLVPIFARLVDIHEKNQAEQTYLHIAVHSGCRDTVNELLRCNVDASIKDKFLKTALHYAADNRYVDIVRLLLPFSDVMEEGETKMTAPEIAIRNEDCITFLTLYEARSYNPRMNAEYLAAALEVDLDLIVYFLLDSCNSVLLNGHLPINIATQFSSNKVFKMILDASDVNKRDTYGGSSAYCVVFFGKLNFLELIFKAVNFKLPHENYLLHYAASLGKENIVEFLLQHIDVNSLNDKGHTALNVAIENDHAEVVLLLLNENADLKAGSDNKTSNPEILELIKEHEEANPSKRLRSARDN